MSLRDAKKLARLARSQDYTTTIRYDAEACRVAEPGRHRGAGNYVVEVVSKFGCRKTLKSVEFAT